MSHWFSYSSINVGLNDIINNDHHFTKFAYGISQHICIMVWKTIKQRFVIISQASFYISCSLFSYISSL